MRIALLTRSLLVLVLGCDVGLDGEAAHVPKTVTGTSALSASSIGLVTGGIYEGGPESFAGDADAIFCELEQLGVSWIRIEANWPGTSRETYRSIVRRARSRGIGVIVVVAGSTCPVEGTHLAGPFADDDSASIDRFTEAYVEQLDALARDTFYGDAAPDAWEITNEPDIHYNPDYPSEYAAAGCVGHSRIDGNTFAWLLRRVYEWRARTGRDEALISGGTLGVPADPGSDGWYSAVLGSGAWAAGPAPVDYWGVHPYLPFSYDTACIARGETSCFAPWGASVRAAVHAVREAIADVAGEDVPLFATEIGWTLPEPDDVTTPEDESVCPPAGMCVYTEAQLDAAMHTSFDALRDDVDYALWYVYRDYVGTRMGLREVYDDAARLHPAKSVWHTFAALAGGEGGDPDACWTGGTTPPPPPTPPSSSHDALAFDAHDARLSTHAGDWRWGSYKAQCAVGRAVTGLSASPADGSAHAALCRDTSHALPQEACRARVFASGDSRGTLATGDWDWGYFKGECAPGEHVAGVSQTPGRAVDAILCCEGTVEHRDCETRSLASGDDRGDLSLGDWDFGFFKAECGAGRVVAGVSRGPGDGRPHAILCCR